LLTAEQLTAFLLQTPMFRNLSVDELSEIAGIMRIKQVREKDVIFEEGDAADGWYIIYEGTMVVVKNMPAGPEHELAHLEVGDCFGEMALLDDSPRGAAVHADTEGLLLQFPRQAFEDLLARDNLAAYKTVREMAKVLCQRQRELTVILADIVDDVDRQPTILRNSMIPLLWTQPHWES